MTASTTQAFPAPYRSDVAHVAWPPIAQADGAQIQAYLARLAETQWLPTDTIAAQQRHQLGLLAAYCAEHSPGFAARLAAVGLSSHEIAAPGGLGRLPPLGRRDLQRGGQAFCDEAPPQHRPVGVTSTSGSTGEPVKVLRTALNRLDAMAMTARDHLWQGRDARGRLATMSAHHTVVHRADTWGAPIGLLFATGPALAAPAMLDVVELMRLLVDFQPQVLVIYPSMLDALIGVLEARGERLSGLRHVRCMSEMLDHAVRVRAEAFFGLRVEDAYTSEECGYIALQCPDAAGYHVMAETHIVEIVDGEGKPCGPGELGRVLVTDLHNFATPLIRYDIGDWAVAGGVCPCGRGLPRIERIAGRTRNLLRKPDGTRHWPLVGYARYRAVAPVRQYQLRQLDLTTIELRLVVERKLSDAEEAALVAVVRKALGHDFAIRPIYFAERLPREPNGKFEEFVCLVPE